MPNKRAEFQAWRQAWLLDGVRAKDDYDAKIIQDSIAMIDRLANKISYARRHEKTAKKRLALANAEIVRLGGKPIALPTKEDEDEPD